MRRHVQRVLLVCLVCATFALTATTALAVGTLTVSPTPVTLDSTFTVAGSGYPAGSSISFELTGPRKSGIHYFTAGAPIAECGCFTQEWTAWWGVEGDYQLTSWYRDKKGSTHKASVVKFAVVAP
jgi:hypothetical protein